MAQLLDKFPARDYPWEEWLDGKPYGLKRGADFDTDVASMRVTVYRAAKRRGVRVRTMVEGGVLSIQRRWTDAEVAADEPDPNWRAVAKEG